MLSGVLRSDRAIAVNVEIMRAFVELRRVANSYAAIEKQLEQIEADMSARLDEHDDQLREIFETRSGARHAIAPVRASKLFGSVEATCLPRLGPGHPEARDPPTRPIVSQPAAR